MDDYFMDQVIDSYVNDSWGCDYDSSGKVYTFTMDRDYYHHGVKFKLIHETEKAYLLESRKGQFLCPKTLFRHARVREGYIAGKLWTDFNPKYLKKETFDEFDILPKVDDKKDKAIDAYFAKRDKKKKKKMVTVSTPSGTDSWFPDPDDFFVKDFLGVK